MRAVDTNVLIRLIVGDDARQVAEAEAFIDNGAWVSLLALAETIWVLGTAYDQPAAEQATAVEMLLNHEKLIVQDSNVAAAALTLFRARASLGYSDCLMLEIARKAGHIPLGAFDRNLSKAEGAQKL